MSAAAAASSSVITRCHQTPGSLASACHQDVISSSLQCRPRPRMSLALKGANSDPSQLGGLAGVLNQWSQYLINWVNSKVNSLQLFGFVTISEFDMFSSFTGTPLGQPWLVRQHSIYALQCIFSVSIDVLWWWVTLWKNLHKKFNWRISITG